MVVEGKTEKVKIEKYWSSGRLVLELNVCTADTGVTHPHMQQIY